MPLLNIGIYPPHIHPETSPSQNYPPPEPLTTRRYWILYHNHPHPSLDTHQIIYGITRNLDNVYVYLRAENAFFIQTSGLLERSVPVGWLEERDIDAFARVVENTKIESGVNDEAGVNAGRGRSYDSQVWVRDVLFAALNTVGGLGTGLC